MSMHKGLPCLLLMALTFPIQSQDKASVSGGGAAVYMVAYRTSAHVRTSKPEGFHSAANDLLGFLKENLGVNLHSWFGSG